MIDQPTIDRILDAANIVDVVSNVTLRKRGINYVGCVLSIATSPPFYVSPAKNICKMLCLRRRGYGCSLHYEA